MSSRATKKPEPTEAERAERRRAYQRRALLGPLLDGPCVLVLHEKHGKTYFHVADEASLFAAALTVLKGRDQDGYWYGATAGDPPKAPAYTDMKEIATLRGNLKESAERQLLEYRNQLAWHEEEKARLARIKASVAEKNGEEAWRILQERSDYEYERVSLEPYCAKYREEKSAR